MSKAKKAKAVGKKPARRKPAAKKKTPAKTKGKEMSAKVVVSKKDLDLDKILILSLVEACKMHRLITTEKENLKILKKELKIIIKECPIAEVVDKTIQQVQAAIIAAIAASAAASAAASSS